ncbi:hypothetical protein Tco_0042773 [Tanacetum coccineum]
MTHWLTGGQPPLTGGPAVVRRWSSGGPPPLTGGPTVVVTRGTTNDWYEVLFIRGSRYEVAGNVRWQYKVAAAGQSEHDTCPKRMIRGCQAIMRRLVDGKKTKIPSDLAI